MNLDLESVCELYFSLTDKPLGETCEAGSMNQCSDPEADCLSDGTKYICTCKVGFYDDNGFTLAGNCKGGKVYFFYLHQKALPSQFKSFLDSSNLSSTDNLCKQFRQNVGPDLDPTQWSL